MALGGQGRTRSGLNGQVASEISSIVIPPEENVYDLPNLPLHLSTNNRVRVSQTFLHPQTAGADASILFDLSNMMLVPRRLMAQYTVYVTIPDCKASIAGSMSVIESAVGIGHETVRARNLYTLWPNPAQKLITASSIKVDGRQLNDDPQARWMIQRVAESHPNITSQKSWSCKQVDATYQAVAGLNTPTLAAPQHLKDANENYVVQGNATGDGCVVAFNIIEYFDSNIFLSENLSTHTPSLHGLQKLEINMTFGRAPREMVRIIQYGYGADGELLDTPGEFSVNISPMLFTIEQEMPVSTMLGNPRCAQWFTTAISSRSYKVGQIQTADALQMMYKPATIGVSFNNLSLNTVPAYIVMWLSYRGTDATGKTSTGLGNGCNAFISSLSVGLNGNDNQLVSFTQTQLTEMTVHNGGFAMPTNHSVLAGAADFNPANMTKMPGQAIIPQAGQILVLDPMRNINTPAQMTAGLFAESMVSMNVGVAQYPGRMKPANHDDSIWLTVAMVGPGWLLSDWSLQSGTTSVIDLQEALTTAARDTSLLSTGVHSMAHPPAFRGHNAYMGGNFKSFWTGAWHKVKHLASQAWDGVKKGVGHVWEQATNDPMGFIGKLSDVAKSVAPLMVGAGGKPAIKRAKLN